MEHVEGHRVVVTRHGGPDVLQVAECERASPGIGEVRVRVLAAGVSAFDLIYRRWARLPGSPKVPFSLGEDVAGLVDEVGLGVDSLEVGQMVVGATFALGVGGGYADYVCLPVADLVPVPADVDPVDATCVAVNYMTAHQHLHHIGRVVEGESVLIHGAAGGVGTALLDLGRLAGLEMYGTASGEQHHVLESFGAVPIDYRNEDFVARVRQQTGDGVDVVIDPIGGAKQLWRSYRALGKGGRLVWLGSAAVEKQGLRVGPLSMATAFLLRLVPDGRSVPRCPTLDELARSDPDWYRSTLSELLDALADGKIEPVIAGRVPLGEAARAHVSMESGGHVGKFVLTTSAYDGWSISSPP